MIFIVKKGDRIAQLVVIRIDMPDVEVADELPTLDSTRGVGGFGSTGVATISGSLEMKSSSVLKYVIKIN